MNTESSNGYLVCSSRFDTLTENFEIGVFKFTDDSRIVNDL